MLLTEASSGQEVQRLACWPARLVDSKDLMASTRSCCKLLPAEWKTWKGTMPLWGVWDTWGCVLGIVQVMISGWIWIQYITIERQSSKKMNTVASESRELVKHICSGQPRCHSLIPAHSAVREDWFTLSHLFQGVHAVCPIRDCCNIFDQIFDPTTWFPFLLS